MNREEHRSHSRRIPHKTIIIHLLLLFMGCVPIALLIRLIGIEKTSPLFEAIRWEYVFGALLATVGITGSIAARWGYIANKVAKKKVASWGDYFHYFAFGMLLGFLVPKDISDFASRTLALSRLHGLGLAKSAVSVLLDRLADILGTGLFLVAVIPYWIGWVGSNAGVGVMLGTAILVSAGFQIVGGRIPLRRPAGWLNKILRWTQQLRKSGQGNLVQIPENDVKMVAFRPVYFLSLIKFFCTALRFVLFALALGLPISPALILLGTPLGQLSYLFAFTPGGLGIFEMGWFGVLKLGGVGTEEAVLFAFGQRVLVIFIIGVLALMSQVIYTLGQRRMSLLNAEAVIDREVNTTSDMPGVLDVTYTSDRHKKPHLRFRLQTRALLAYQSYLDFGNGSVEPVVIDYGAADGLTLLELAKHFEYRGNFVGVEYSQQLIDSVPPLPENVKLLCGDVAALPPEIGEESTDLVTALAVLEHLPNPAAAICEAFRILRPEGLLVATCPDPRWDRIATALGLMKAEQHESDLDSRRLCTLVTNGGFELVEYRRFMFSLVSFLPYLRIPLATEQALSFDYYIEKLRLARPMFVNQAVVAKKL